MALSNFTRPQLPYAAQSLANNDRFQVLTRALNSPPTDIMLDSELNALTDYANILDVKIAQTGAGTLPGVNDPNNTNFLVSTDGTNQIWTLLTDQNVQVGSVNANKLIDSSVTAQQIQNGTIVLSKMAPASVDTSNLIDGSVISSKLATDSVGTSNLLDGCNTLAKQAPASVGTSNLVDNCVTTPKISNANVTLAKLAQEVLDRLVPIGTVVEFAGSAGFPAMWLECNGQAISRATYATLFANLGTVYGVGNGATTFNLPDRRGRVSVGIGADSSTGGRITNATAPSITLGGAFGNETHTLNVLQIPSHTHGLAWSFNNIDFAGGITATSINNVNSAVQTSATGGGQSHNNVQPSIFMRYYIRAL